MKDKKYQTAGALLVALSDRLKQKSKRGKIGWGLLNFIQKVFLPFLLNNILQKKFMPILSHAKDSLIPE
jgi:hypothetical protein